MNFEPPEFSQTLPPVRVTLDNCDREPIHIPGSIQPHGALLAFDAQGRVIAQSNNVRSLLGIAGALGQPAAALGLPAEAVQVIDDYVRESSATGSTGNTSEGNAPAGHLPATMLDLQVEGRGFDLIVHAYGGRVIAEFEQREAPATEAAAFALKAHMAIDRIKRQTQLPVLLQMVVEQVRAITGFDRVMAYRFRHDDSGDVVAEARAEGVDSFLGMRYPASDIPAQARRLYTINTLRLIPDVDYAPVPLSAIASLASDTAPSGARGTAQAGAALDLSHSTLRSVSPIHVEYLQNMGVHASMSVSIVIAGRLWGMLACHNRAPRLVPYSVRLACDVIAQVLAATVQTLDAKIAAEHAERAAVARTRLLETLLREDDVLRVLAANEQVLRETLGAEALVLTVQGKLLHFGAVTLEQATAVARSLPHAEGDDLLQRNAVTDWPEEARAPLRDWPGMLGLRFDPPIDGWLVALRREQVQTVRWGGNPEKEIKVGPLGPRLTPRGSFGEWRETVRGRAEPWDAAHLAIARALLAELHRVSNSHHAEVERARTQMLAMLGHDLRDPLQSIAVAAQVIEHGSTKAEAGAGGAPGNNTHVLSKRIQASSSRMQRLISQVLDMSRLEAGLGLNISKQPTELRGLLGELLEESRTAYPGALYELHADTEVTAQVDPDRVAQVIGNLVSNARHHGKPGEPIQITLTADAQDAHIVVSNLAPPIEDALAATLFRPFKRQSVVNQRNRTGLGLGLHIAGQIVQAHSGSLRYFYTAPRVNFELALPLVAVEQPAQPPAPPQS